MPSAFYLLANTICYNYLAPESIQDSISYLVNIVKMFERFIRKNDNFPQREMDLGG